MAHAVARAIGDADVADLTAEDFDPRFTDADLNLYRGTGSTPADVAAEQQRIDRAEHLVLVFPMYWWSMPALLKGWIDRVFVGGWAYDFTPGGEFTKKLGHLTVHLVVIAGDDADSFERHGIHAAVETQIERGIVEYCGARLGSTTYLHESGTKSPDAIADEVTKVSEAVAEHVSGCPRTAELSRL
jgi:NAD(P)H dehydrogenase (quinone)